MNMRRIRTALGTGLLVAALLCAMLPAIAHADDGRLVVDQSGANGAIIGSVVDSKPGSARIVVQNKHEFWTTIDLSSLGVTLTPGTLLFGGSYAELGMIAPGAAASWNANWNPRQAAQVSVLTTPYLHQTSAGPQAAALTVLTIIAKLLPGTSQAVARAESLQHAANLVGTAMGDELVTLLTVEGLTSGAFGRSLFGALSDPLKAEVLRQALALFGVTTTAETLNRLDDWITVVQAGLLILDLASALLTSTSSGGLLFTSEGTGVPDRSSTGTQPPQTPTSVPTTPSTTPPRAPDRQALPPRPADPPTSGSPDPGTSPPRSNPDVQPPPQPAKNLSNLRIYAVEVRNATRPGAYYHCGDQVLLIMGIDNPNDRPVDAEISAAVFLGNGQGEFFDEQRVSIPKAMSAANWNFTLPARRQTYTYVADIYPSSEIQGTDASTSFTVDCDN